MVYGSEVMISAENKIINQCKGTLDPENNEQLLATNLDLLEDAREITRMRVATYQQCVARYYN